MPETTRALSIRRFAAMLFRAAPRATLVSIVLMVLVALTEGVGIFLLVPLLALAGVTTGTALPQSGMLGRLTAHLPHSLGLLLLVYVVENSVPISTDYVTIECAETIRREQATALLERTRLLMPDTLQVDTLVCSGYAAEEIVEAGIAWRADLIMIGTRGRGRLAHFVLGSTADAIIRHARCPVVSVGHEPSHPPAQWGGIVSDLTVATTPHSASGGEC